MARTRIRSDFVQTLRRALEADVREEIELAIKVAILYAASYTERGIAERLDISTGEVRAIVKRLQRVAPGLNRYGGGADFP